MGVHPMFFKEPVFCKTPLIASDLALVRDLPTAYWGRYGLAKK
jgi:hypothetical protein